MAGAARVRVWDVPTRLVHWLIVVLVGASWWTGETGRLEWHRWSGYTLTGVVLFRLYWGFFGSSTARFSRFVSGPRGVVDYLRGRWTVAAGHNPLGSWSVVVLIVLLVTQVALGLFAVDVDGIESGPLSMYVSFEMGRTCARLHHLVFNGLLVLIAVHIAAVLFYQVFRKENLVGGMVTGKRLLRGEGVTPVLGASWIRLIVGIVVASTITWLIARAFQF
jgi:cytochrome b